MPKLRRLISLLLLSVGLLIIPCSNAASQNGGEAVLLQLEGSLTTAMSSYLGRGLRLAAQREAEVVVVQIDTPGGSVELMSQMVSDIRASTVPVVMYVAPRGAIAGSAGTVITLAGHAAAMAPQTAIGAASPVGSQGEDIGETLESKIKQIIKAQIRTLAQERPPEAVAAAEDTVENASALTAGEALQIGLVDYIAEDVPDLLRQLDGHTVVIAGEKRTLHTEYLTVYPVETSMLEDLLDILTDPNIVFLLLALGLQAILIEIGSPGGWFAGFLGVISLALAAYGLGSLPVNYFGLIFILTSFVLFFLEVKAPTHGALAAAGLISFVVGALVLFNSADTPPALRVSVPLVIATGLVIAVSFIAILTFALRAQKTPQRMGERSLLDRSGLARTDIPRDGQGKVHLGGEMWTAEVADGEDEVKAGERVLVVGVEGLRLVVKRK